MFTKVLHASHQKLLFPSPGHEWWGTSNDRQPGSLHSHLKPIQISSYNSVTMLSQTTPQSCIYHLAIAIDSSADQETLSIHHLEDITWNMLLFQSASSLHLLSSDQQVRQVTLMNSYAAGQTIHREDALISENNIYKRTLSCSSPIDLTNHAVRRLIIRLRKMLMNKSTPNSCSPQGVTSGKLFFSEVDFHWCPTTQYDLNWTHPGFELRILDYPSVNPYPNWLLTNNN